MKLSALCLAIRCRPGGECGKVPGLLSLQVSIKKENMERSPTDLNVTSRIHEDIRTSQGAILQTCCSEIRKTVKYLQQSATRPE
jgi:hypothetical protein